VFEYRQMRDLADRLAMAERSIEAARG
jgi:hypothetical protein